MRDLRHFDVAELHKLRSQLQENLLFLEQKLASYGLDISLKDHNELLHARAELAAVEAELECRQQDQTTASPAALLSPLDAAPVVERPRAGAPFVVGKPLAPSDPIFGRAEALRLIGSALVSNSPVNVVAERRMGKTSLLRHVLVNYARYLPQQPAPPVQLVWIDLQAVPDAPRFYYRAARALLERRAEPAWADWHARLTRQPTLEYEELEQLLRTLAPVARPVLLVDEFECLLEPQAAHGFPFPHFFNGLRALMTADLLSMVVASRLALPELEAAHPSRQSSTFASYFQTYRLPLLDTAAADALLTQPSPHPLTPQQVAEARAWASGHPCLLQAAGAAAYAAHAEQRSADWVRARREQLKADNCRAGAALAQPPPWWLRHRWPLAAALIVACLIILSLVLLP